MGGWRCTTGRSGPRLHRRAPIGPDCTVGPDWAPIAPSIAPSGPNQGEIALSLVALHYKAASSATPAVRMVSGRSARILGVRDIARVSGSIGPESVRGRPEVRLHKGFHQGSTKVPPGYAGWFGVD